MDLMQGRPRKDISGTVIGRYAVLKFAGMVKNGKPYWLCVCKCCNITRKLRQDHLIKTSNQLTCTRSSRTKGFGNPESLATQKLLSNIAVSETGCWEWQRGIDGNGYGVMYAYGKKRTTHRIAYELFCGPINELCVLHKCDNKLCCYPLHLFLGTIQDNSDDMVNKGRSTYGEKNPASKLTWSQVREMRQLHANKTASLKELSVRFGVCWLTVHNVVSGVTWNESRKLRMELQSERTDHVNETKSC